MTRNNAAVSRQDSQFQPWNGNSPLITWRWPIGSDPKPALTTMRNPIEQTALQALGILDDQLAGRLRKSVHVLLSSELVERDSA